ncbi:MAG: replication-associated recombination protein A [Chloroflexi bacterium]|nr:replication-associated recombination protein A [Chloroflexota bacterium]
MTLFDHQSQRELQSKAPLAARMRPSTFDEFVGQQHIIGPDTVLRRSIESDQLPSIILWGPPGTGKTTLANLIATTTESHFERVSGVTSGVADLRRIAGEARERLGMHSRSTVLFIDEIHRFNKAQQDVILPFVEDGTLVLIGATTENPSFEVVSPLLSRTRVFALQSLTDEEVGRIIAQAVAEPHRGVGHLQPRLDEDATALLVNLANGDARAALQTLETSVVAAGGSAVTEELLESVLQRKMARYDKSGEEHYNLISALHKSVRSSDPDAALYWLVRILDGGEDRLYILRRLVRMAFEDIGLADPRALEQATAAVEAFRLIGEPEGDLVLAQVAVYLAMAPKSDSVYAAFGQVKKDVQQTIADPVPLHLRNAPTSLMKQLGYGEGYQHAHQFEDAVTSMECLPEALRGRRYYFPTNRGIEKRIGERLEELRRKRKKHHTEPSSG